jgi:hypothetical protein
MPFFQDFDTSLLCFVVSVVKNRFLPAHTATFVSLKRLVFRCKIVNDMCTSILVSDATISTTPRGFCPYIRRYAAFFFFFAFFMVFANHHMARTLAQNNPQSKVTLAKATGAFRSLERALGVLWAERNGLKGA